MNIKDWFCLALMCFVIMLSFSNVEGQSIIGSVTEIRGDGTVRIDLETATSARAGILAFAIRWDEEAEEWFPIAEIAIESVGGGVALGRVIEASQDTSILPGVAIGVFEPVRDDDVSLRVTPPQLALLVGETASLDAEFVDARGEFMQTVTARWRSSNESIASVSTDGRVVATGVGEALIIGQASGGVLAAATVRVLEPDLDVPDSIVAFAGVQQTVEVRLAGQDRRAVSPRSFRWSIDDPTVATVDGFGVLRPTNQGVTQIRFSGLNVDGSIPLQVLPPPAEVFFRPAADSLVLAQGEQVELRATIRMPDGSVLEDLTPQVTALNDLLVAWDGSGTLSGSRVGQTRVAVRFAGEDWEWDVQVIQPSLSLEFPQRAIRVGERIPLSARLRGENQSDLGPAVDVSWSVSDPGIAEVDGQELVGLGVGPVTVRGSLAGRQVEEDVLVLGDILLSVEVDGEPGLYTLSFDAGQVWRLPGTADGMSQGVLAPDGLTLAHVSPSEGFASPPRVRTRSILDPSSLRQITSDPTGSRSMRNPVFQEHYPVWGSDGRTLFFLSNRTGTYEVYSVNLDSPGGVPRRLTRGSSLVRRLDSASQSPVIALEARSEGNRGQILLMLPDGADAQVVLGTQSAPGVPVAYGAPSLFGDGRGGVFTRWTIADDRSGQELVLVEFGDGEGQHRIRSLVPAIRDHDMVHSVSPDGSVVAYGSRPRLGGDTSAIVKVDLEGRILRSVSLPPGYRLAHISWVPGGYVR